MKFIKDGEILKAIRITGPEHNYVGITLGEPDSYDQAVMDSKRIGKEPDRLDSELVRDAVMDGISRANKYFQTSFSVARIEFVPSDTPPEQIYADIAYSIIKRLMLGESNFDGIE